MSNRRRIKPTHREPTPTTFWNGLPAPAERGTALVADAPQFPAYWARTEGLIGSRIPVVMVNLDGINSGGDIAYLDDRDGSGWAKVRAGGSPRQPHRNVAIEPGSFASEATT